MEACSTISRGVGLAGFAWAAGPLSVCTWLPAASWVETWRLGWVFRTVFIPNILFRWFTGWSTGPDMSVSCGVSVRPV